MPALKNQRWERFCFGLLEGRPAVQAYESAGYKPSRKNASRLRAKEDIQVRLTELKAEAAEAATLDRAWVLAQLQALFKLTSTPKQGEPTWAPAVAKGSLELLGRDIGMYVERKIIGIKRLDEMGDEELRQIAGEVIEELDAKVTVDGDVQPLVAELIEPKG